MHPHRRRKLSSETGLDVRRVLDRPLSMFHDSGDPLSTELDSLSLELERRLPELRLREPSGDRLRALEGPRPFLSSSVGDMSYRTMERAYAVSKPLGLKKPDAWRAKKRQLEVTPALTPLGRWGVCSQDCGQKDSLCWMSQG